MDSSKKHTSIDSYIKDFPEHIQLRLEDMRKTIQAAAPDATETISYGIPTFKLNGNLVHFGGYAKHIGFYPGAGAIKEFASDIAPYPTSKGTIQFSHENPLPLELVARITKFRAEQNLAKSY